MQTPCLNTRILQGYVKIIEKITNADDSGTQNATTTATECNYSYGIHQKNSKKFKKFKKKRGIRSPKGSNCNLK